MVRDEPQGRPQAGDATQARGDPDRAGGVRSERSRREVCSSSRSAATARATADPVGRPGIAGRPKVGRGRRGTEGELVRVELAENDRACLTQSFHGQRISRGDVVGQNRRCSRGACSCDVDHVLDADRYTPQRPAPLGPRERVGLGEGFVSAHRDVGVDLAVDLLDPVEVGLGCLPRAQDVGSELTGELRDAHGAPSPVGAISSGSCRSISSRAGRIRDRKPSTASRSASDGATPSAAACARSSSTDGCWGLDSTLMPVYEYRCTSCDETYEEFLKSSTAEAPPCPKCGSTEVTRLLSRINTEWLPSDVSWDRVGRSWD